MGRRRNKKEELQEMLANQTADTERLTQLFNSKRVENVDEKLNELSKELADKLRRLEQTPRGYTAHDSKSYTWGSGGGNYEITEITTGGGGMTYEVPQNPKTDRRYHIDPDVMDKLSESMREFGAGTQEFVDAFKRATEYAKPRKTIHSINIEVENNVVDVTSFGELPTYAKGKTYITITDQDGEKVPDELHESLEAAYRHGELTPTTLRETLDEWNGVDRDPTLTEGHKRVCLYLGTHEYPCTCQPPTLWGQVKRYHCDCCSEARAKVHHGLCDLCAEHQNDPGHHAESEHRVRAMSE